MNYFEVMTLIRNEIAYERVNNAKKALDRLRDPEYSIEKEIEYLESISNYSDQEIQVLMSAVELQKKHLDETL